MSKRKTFIFIGTKEFIRSNIARYIRTLNLGIILMIIIN